MLRMEIALFLVLALVAYIYFSAERKSSPLHRTFSVLLVTALGWLAYIMALWLPSGAGKLMYVILPFVFAAVPLWYVSSAVVALLRAGDKLKRSEAEKVAGNLPSASVFGIILTAVALIAEGVTAIAAPEKLNAADIAFAAGAGILCAAFVLSFSRRQAVATKLI